LIDKKSYWMTFWVGKRLGVPFIIIHISLIQKCFSNTINLIVTLYVFVCINDFQLLYFFVFYWFWHHKRLSCILYIVSNTKFNFCVHNTILKRKKKLEYTYWCYMNFFTIFLKNMFNTLKTKDSKLSYDIGNKRTK